MKILITYTFLIFFISANLIFPGNNKVIVGTSLNHHFPIKLVPALDVTNYSLSLQYSRSISNYFDIGVKGMIDNLLWFNESNFENQSIKSPLLLTLNYYIVPNEMYTQFGAGVVIDLGGDYDTEEIFTSRNTGLVLGIATGFNFKLWQFLGGNFEIGLTYKKFNTDVFINENSQLTANIRMGVLLDF